MYRTSRTALFLAVLFCVVFTSHGEAQPSAHFAGDWVLRIGSRIFLVVTVASDPEDARRFTGTLARLQHFSSSFGGRFSGIKGPTIRYPIVRSTVKATCLLFTTQNPADKSDEDNSGFAILVKDTVR
jgi:hypothetical protein